MIPLVRTTRALAAAALLAGLAGCSEVSAPVTTEAWTLDRLNGQPLPALLDGSAHRTIEVVAGILVLHSDGRARSTLRVRITDAGGEPVEQVDEAAGTWQRTGGHVVVTLASGWTHTFEVQAGGQRLRTTAMNCTRDCAMATSVLHIFEFQRAVIIGSESGF
jgi:hypothetical protein